MLKSSDTELETWARTMFKVIDAEDAQGFADYFCEDGVFIFGSFPTACGKSTIRDFVAGFFSSLKGLHHELVQIVAAGGLLYIHFEVTYEVQDGRKVTIPGLETVKMKGDLIEEYVIYMDPSPLLALQSTSAE